MAQAGVLSEPNTGRVHELRRWVIEIPSGGGAQADMRSGRKRAASGRREVCLGKTAP